MKNQYKKIVYLDENGIIHTIKAKKGMTIEATKNADGKLIINNTDAIEINYENPPIPNGWKHISGEWHKGFVIERESDKSQFVWIPVSILTSDGTLDGHTFDKKFGRRYFRKKNSSFNLIYNEAFEGTLQKQAESVKKYGGFYISRYEMSTQNGKPSSVKNLEPLTNIDFYEAVTLAKSFENSSEVKSHLTYGAEYDSTLKWIIESNTKKERDVVVDSAEWGNYANFCKTSKIEKTGSNETWCANGIYDLAGNVEEWTQEKFDGCFRVTRGGNYRLDGRYYPASHRNYRVESEKCNSAGFRVVLYIK